MSSGFFWFSMFQLFDVRLQTDHLSQLITITLQLSLSGTALVCLVFYAFVVYRIHLFLEQSIQRSNLCSLEWLTVSEE